MPFVPTCTELFNSIDGSCHVPEKNEYKNYVVKQTKNIIILGKRMKNNMYVFHIFIVFMYELCKCVMFCDCIFVVWMTVKTSHQKILISKNYECSSQIDNYPILFKDYYPILFKTWFLWNKTYLYEYITIIMKTAIIERENNTYRWTTHSFNLIKKMLIWSVN